MRRLPRRWLREAVTLAVTALVLLTTRSVVADHYQVPSGSMEPTVAIGDHILVNKLAYGVRVPFTDAYLASFGGPAHGDVVVLASPVDGETLLKRVVAVPGDTVQVRGGQLVLNGRPIPIEAGATGPEERIGEGVHAVRLTGGGGPDLPATRIPDDRYLVMGDNRGDSYDGRLFGLVEGDAIRGRAVAIVYRDGLTWLAL